MNKMKNFTFRKRLLALALCAFAWIGVNAAEVIDGVYYIYGTGVEGHVADDLSHVDPPAGATITTVKLVGKFNGWSSGWLQNGGSDSKENITTIDLESADFSGVTATKTGEDGNATITVSPSGWSLRNFGDVKTILWPTNNSMTVLPENAFYACGIEDLTFPTSLKYICGFAFSTCANLKTVEFPEGMTELYIKNKAFAQTINITDVYVMCEVDLRAEYESFDFTTTNAQTNPDGLAASLHFPESNTANYANLSHPLTPDDVKTPGAFQTWLNAHRNAARTSAQGSGNGWHEFINAGSLPPDVVIESGEVILRTYSNLEYDHLTPAGFKAYIVVGINANKELQLLSVPVIPARTGVILYGQSNATTRDGNPTFSMTTVNYTGHAITRENYEQYGAEYVPTTNFLVPTCYGTYKDSDGNDKTIKQLRVGPYEVDDEDNPTKVTFRNFSLAKFSSTETGKKTTGVDNYRGFFRLKKGNDGKGTLMPADKAYLKLKADEYKDYQGGECIVVKDPNYTKVYEAKTENPQLVEEFIEGKNDYWTKAIWENPVSTNNWGVRSSSVSMAKCYAEPFFEDSIIEENEDGTATLILPNGFIESETDSEYYTLQGVKVSHPTKGVYIKDGKKVVIK